MGELLHDPGHKDTDFSKVMKEIEDETIRVCGSSKGVTDKGIGLKVPSTTSTVLGTCERDKDSCLNPNTAEPFNIDAANFRIQACHRVMHTIFSQARIPCQGSCGLPRGRYR
jgi:hypothetical protein